MPEYLPNKSPPLADPPTPTHRGHGDVRTKMRKRPSALELKHTAPPLIERGPWAVQSLLCLRYRPSTSIRNRASRQIMKSNPFDGLTRPSLPTLSDIQRRMIELTGKPPQLAPQPQRQTGQAPSTPPPPSASPHPTKFQNDPPASGVPLLAVNPEQGLFKQAFDDPAQTMLPSASIYLSLGRVRPSQRSSPATSNSLSKM